jgi:N-acetylmuramoyl-L-alanine amidase
MMEGLPLGPGARGEPVRDLQRRLTAAGFPAAGHLGAYDPPTQEAVRSFQGHRGLVADGVCGHETWSALIEAGHQLGDRLLYLRSPMLRGDDVGELQRKLGALGFDAGRVDAIFGPDTELAVKDFERNAGLTTDGVCGPEVVAALARLGAMTAGPATVPGIRERQRLAGQPRHLLDRRIAVGNLGGLEVPAIGTARALQDAGAIVTVLDHPDRTSQAHMANDFDAELYIGLSVSADGCARAAYYSTAGFESFGGRRMAELVADELSAVFPKDAPEPAGMRLPILRETRMPAVVCHLPSVDQLVVQHPELARALRRAATRWAEEPPPA